MYKNWSSNPPFSESITTEIVLSQEFLVKCDSIDGIRIWTNRMEQPGGTTTITIFKAPSEQIIHQEIIDNLSFSQNQWTLVDFSTSTIAKSQRFHMVFSSIAPVKEEAINIALSPRDEYQDGKLMINNTPVEKDIIFQYRCVVD